MGFSVSTLTPRAAAFRPYSACRPLGRQTCSRSICSLSKHGVAVGIHLTSVLVGALLGPLGDQVAHRDQLGVVDLGQALGVGGADGAQADDSAAYLFS